MIPWMRKSQRPHNEDSDKEASEHSAPEDIDSLFEDAPTRFSVGSIFSTVDNDPMLTVKQDMCTTDCRNLSDLPIL